MFPESLSQLNVPGKKSGAIMQFFTHLQELRLSFVELINQLTEAINEIARRNEIKEDSSFITKVDVAVVSRIYELWRRPLIFPFVILKVIDATYRSRFISFEKNVKDIDFCTLINALKAIDIYYLTTESSHLSISQPKRFEQKLFYQEAYIAGCDQSELVFYINRYLEILLDLDYDQTLGSLVEMLRDNQQVIPICLTGLLSRLNVTIKNENDFKQQVIGLINWILKVFDDQRFATNSSLHVTKVLASPNDVDASKTKVVANDSASTSIKLTAIADTSSTSQSSGASVAAVAAPVPVKVTATDVKKEQKKSIADVSAATTISSSHAVTATAAPAFEAIPSRLSFFTTFLQTCWGNASFAANSASSSSSSSSGDSAVARSVMGTVSSASVSTTGSNSSVTGGQASITSLQLSAANSDTHS